VYVTECMHEMGKATKATISHVQVIITQDVGYNSIGCNLK